MSEPPVRSAGAGARPGRFPDGRRFAFTAIDDTDVATVANVKPVYDLLRSLGLFTTKTVWAHPCPDGRSDFATSETLADQQCREFVWELQRQGFEIAWHGATMESSDRQRTIEGFEAFRALLGAFPRVHANHARNRENLYWGVDRLDDPILRVLYGRLVGVPRDYFSGHRPESPYWWGDLCADRIEYVRNLTFSDIDVLRVNPSMPYHDPRRPLVAWWFSCADAENAEEFVQLLSPSNIARLERDGGVCIVSTHFGKGFVRGGHVDPRVEAALRGVAARSGWFVPVGTLLDHLRMTRGDGHLRAGEWRRMQWRWFRDVVARRLAERWRMG